MNKFIKRRCLPRKTAQKCLEMLLLLHRLHIFASDQTKEERNKKVFAFLATFEQLLPFFGATFQQLYEKLRATFWEISSNLWQALRGGGGVDGTPPLDFRSAKAERNKIT